MPLRHALLAAAVAAMWGLNFLAIHASLEQFPPLFLVGLRFAVLAIPTVLFVPRPNVAPRWLIGYGLGFGTLQFFGLYLGMAAGFPAGLASLVLQSSAPFTVLLGAVLGERIGRRALLGVLVAVGGLALVGLSRGGAESWMPFWLVVLGGFGWALGNLASRRAAAPEPLRMICWMSLVPVLPMVALSLLVEGPEQIAGSLSSSVSVEALPAWLGLGYTVIVATLLGSGIWVWLMARHAAGVVAPFSMLVPVVGIVAAWWALGERPTGWELCGAALVVGGVLWGMVRQQAPKLVELRAGARTP